MLAIAEPTSMAGSAMTALGPSMTPDGWVVSVRKLIGAEPRGTRGTAWSTRSRHDQEGSAEDAWLASRPLPSGCRKAHFRESILDDVFRLHAPWSGIGVTEAQDQRPHQRRRNTIECEA